jgi:MFS family permease
VTETASTTGSWRALLGGRYLGTSVVLAGGVALYATNEFLTGSLLPNTVAEIGGSRLYAWVTTLYLVGSVVAATLVSTVLIRVGPRASYLLGLAVFAAASLVCGMAPNMGILIAGRALQGVAGGLLAGLGYAVINTALPRALWTRAAALVSAMWGVATVVGPATGGLFAQFGLWRWAFVAMAILTALVAVLVPIALAPKDSARLEAVGAAPKVPVGSLLLLGATALAVSVAQLPRNFAATVALLVATAALIGLFLIVDRRMRAKVLPPSVFGPGPLKWLYLTMAVMMVGAMVTTYVPLFGQRLAHLTPLTAGFLGAALAFGWTVSEIVSASRDNPRTVARAITVAPVIMAAGLALGAATQRDNAPTTTVALWALALLVAGVGIGLAWPHLSVLAMDSVDDPADPSAGGVAAAAINIVQVISGAFGAGVAGVIVNSVDSAGAADAAAARWLYAAFAVLAALGVFASYRACFPARAER